MKDLNCFHFISIFMHNYLFPWSLYDEFIFRNDILALVEWSVQNGEIGCSLNSNEPCLQSDTV